MGLKCIQVKKFKVTTDSKHPLPVAANLLESELRGGNPSTVWGTDITYVPTDEGWLYLAGVKDLASREILGYAMGSTMSTELVRAALRKAVQFRRPVIGCIHHSDRGSQPEFKWPSQHSLFGLGVGDRSRPLQVSSIRGSCVAAR